MSKHFGLGECLTCDTCGTMFYQDPVDKNETCRDCIDGKDIPKCVDCELLLKRDHKGERCDDCEDKHVDAFWKKKNAELQAKRITVEGFEVGAYEAEGAPCHYHATRKVKRQWATVRCGKPSIVELKMAGPNNPAGIRVPFCRGCLAKHIKDLIGYLED